MIKRKHYQRLITLVLILSFSMSFFISPSAAAHYEPEGETVPIEEAEPTTVSEPTEAPEQPDETAPETEPGTEPEPTEEPETQDKPDALQTRAGQTLNGTGATYYASGSFSETTPADNPNSTTVIASLDGQAGIELSTNGDYYTISDANGLLALAKYANGNSTAGMVFYISSGLPITLDSTFPGIGSADYPFAGSIQSSFPTTLQLNGSAALFRYLSSSADLFTAGSVLTISAGTVNAEPATPSFGGLAQVLLATTASMSIGSNLVINGTVSNAFHSASDLSDTGLLFGRVEASCDFALSVANSVVCSAATSQNYGDTGALIGTIESGAHTVTLTLTALSTAAAVTSEQGNAGGLIGSVEGTLLLNLPDVSFSFPAAVTAIGGHSGGIVGSVNGTLVFGASAQTPDDIAISALTAVNAYISGTVGGVSGGLVGMLANGSRLTAGTVSVSQAHVAGGRAAGGLLGCADCTELTLTAATVSNSEIRGDTHCGGAIGSLLANSAITLVDWMTVSGTTIVPVNATHNTATAAAGGLIGDVSITSGDFTLSATAAITSALRFDMSSMRADNNNLHIGGLFGAITTGSRAQTVSVSQTGNAFIAASTLASGMKAGAYGGLIGSVSANTYCELQSIRVSAISTENSTVNSAGLLAILDEGAVLVCSVSQSVNHKDHNSNGVFTVARAESGSAISLSGSLTFTGSAGIATVVKWQNNALIYCESGFTVTRGSAADGDDIGNYGQIFNNATIGNLISCTNHTVTVTKGTAAIASLSDFARLAITLSTQGVFSGITDITSANYQTLLSSTISLGCDLNLTGTGIESLTRTDINTDAFTGTLQTTGGTKTVTLAIGNRVSAANDGVFCKETEISNTPHKYLGFFAAINGATAQNIAFTGAARCDNSNTAYEYVGALASYATGTVSVTDCSTAVSLSPARTYSNKTEDGRGYYGGLLGYYSGNDLTVSSCTSTATIDITMQTAAENTPACGGFIGNIETNAGAFSFTNNTLGAQITVIGSSKNARVGGFAAIINSTGICTVTMTGLASSTDTPPSNTVRASNTVGGLLGYSWSNVDALLSGTVNGTVNVTNKGSFGGLLYSVKGKLTLSNTFSMDGTYTGTHIDTADNMRSDGLVACMGQELFLVAQCPYANLSGAEITNPAINRVDRLVGNNITDLSIDEVAEHGGIVSIETGEGIGVMPAAAPGTDWYNAEKNPNTRYYYNIASLSGQSTTLTQIGTISDLLTWHLVKYTGKKIVGFNQSSGTAFQLQNDLNAAGICIYPTSLTGTNVTNTFTFANHQLTFGLPAQAADIANALSQNYAVQTGLLLDVKTSLTVENARFSGTINHLADSAGSGVLVVGRLQGNYTNAANPDSSLNISGIVLNNLQVDNAAAATYAPLLINRIIENIDANINNISQIGYTAGVPAATSLIGHVGAKDELGNITSSYLNFLLGNIVLNTANATTNFKNSSLFQSIFYTSGTSGFNYNFNIGEDWTSTTHLQQVTYGRELTADRTEYYDVNKYVSPTTNPVTSPLADVYDYNGYIPYVADTTGSKLVVNLKSGDLINGWGTYAHPYRITSANQLIALDSFLSNGTASSGWQIRYHDKTAAYGQGDVYTYQDGTVTPNTTSVGNLRAWLQEAYFVIDAGEIDLSSANFTGIGTDLMPFHGVIAGNNARIVLPPNTDLEAGGLIKVANGCVVKGLTVEYSGQTSISVNEGSYFGGVIGKIIGGDNIIDSVSVNGLSADDTANLTIKTRVSFVGGYVGWILKGGLIFRGSNAGTADYLGEAAYSNYYYAAPYLGRVIDGYAFNENAGAALNNTGKNYPIPTVAPSVDNSRSIVINTSATPATATLETAEELLIFASAVNSNSLTFTNSNSAYTTATRVRSAAYGDIGAAQVPERIADDSFTSAATVPYLVKNYFGSDTDKTLNTGIKTLLQLVFSGSDYNLNGYGNAFRGIGGEYFSTPTLLLAGVTGNNATVHLNMTRMQYYAASLSARYEQYSSGNVGLFNYVTYNSDNSAMTFDNLTLCGNVSLQYADASSGAFYASSIQAFNTVQSPTTWFTPAGISAGGLIGKFACTATNISNDILFENIQLGVGAQSPLTVVSQDVAGGMIGFVAEPDHKEGSSERMRLINCGYNGLTVSGKSKAGGLIGFARLRNTTISNTAATVLMQNATITVERANAAIGFTASGNNESRTEDVAAGGLIGFCYGKKDFAKYVLIIRDVQTSNVNVLTMTDEIAQRSNMGSGGIIGRTDWLSVGIDGVTVTDSITVSGCGTFTERATYPEIDSAALNGLGTYRKYADWLLSLVSNNYGSGFSGAYLDGFSGGVIGSLGNHSGSNSYQLQVHSVTLRDISVASSANGRTLIAGYNCGGGLVGDNRTKTPSTANAATADAFNAAYPRKATLVVEGCDVGASGGPVVILGGTRAAGVVAYCNQELGTVIIDESENGATQIGSVTTPVYIVAPVSNDQSVAAGAVSDSAANVTVSNFKLTGARLAGRVASGVIGKITGGTQGSARTVLVSDSTVDSAWLYSYSRDASCCAGGVLATSTSASGREANCYMNRVTVKDCAITRTPERSDNFTGGLAGLHNAKLYGNGILWSNNRIGATSATFANSGKYSYILTAAAAPASLTNAKVGIWIGKASAASVVQLLAVSRLDTSAAPLTAEINNGTPSKKAIVYTSYHVNTAQEIATEPSYSVGGWRFSSDAVGFVTGTRTPSYQNSSVSWWKSAVKLDQTALDTALITYADVDDTALADIAQLPLFALNGNVDTVLKQYLNLMTNSGISDWQAEGLTVAFDSRQYTVTQTATATTLTQSAERNSGSVIYNETDGVFKNGNQYDIISDDERTFTVLTVTFTNNSGANNATDTYAMNLLLYYPQVLHLNTHVMPLGYEEYGLSNFFQSAATGFQTSTDADGTISLYLEYVYNEMRNNNDWNFDKLLRSMNDTLTDAGTPFPVGTVFTMIDLNSSTPAGYQAYYQTLAAASTEISFADFQSTAAENNALTYIPLSELRALTGLTTFGGTELTAAQKEIYGLERYLMIVTFPENYTVNPLQPAAFYLYADAEASHNVTIERERTGANRAFVTVFAKTALGITGSPVQSQILNDGAATAVDLVLNVSYPPNYVESMRATNENLHNYGVVKFYVRDGNNREIALPAGTEISILDRNRNVLQSNYLSVPQTDNSFTLTGDLLLKPPNMDTYTVQLDFSRVTAAVYNAAFPDSNYYFNADFFLTEMVARPESGSKVSMTPHITLTTVLANAAQLAVQPTGDTLTLGVNFHNTIDDTDLTNGGLITFDVIADFTGVPQALTNSVLSFRLLRKLPDGTYQEIPQNQLSQYLTALTCDGASLLGAMQMNVQSEMQDDKLMQKSFSLQVNPNITYFANYKLEATLTVTAGENTVTGINHLIYTVAKIKNSID